MRRPRQHSTPRPSNAAERDRLAHGARYVGSKEHKAQRWWGGLPGAWVSETGVAARPKKQQTTICELVRAADRHRATDWVRAAIRQGQYKYVEMDQDYPKHIWYEADGRIWCGFCINTAAGEYKGWPSSESERDAIFGRLD